MAADGQRGLPGHGARAAARAGDRKGGCRRGGGGRGCATRATASAARRARRARRAQRRKVVQHRTCFASNVEHSPCVCAHSESMYFQPRRRYSSALSCCGQATEHARAIVLGFHDSLRAAAPYRSPPRKVSSSPALSMTTTHGTPDRRFGPYVPISRPDHTRCLRLSDAARSLSHPTWKMPSL